ncbi:hypothetical protein PSN45_002008 [Yamadazyma tenuis]|uniref:uncharacterized protein n=1 Tax=Candida tenuis TaxID=2315449 RepID=UPI0027A72E42|nr:hypothetical protein PSN45_002008 [Yamadazyma tenuis]
MAPVISDDESENQPSALPSDIDLEDEEEEDMEESEVELDDDEELEDEEDIPSVSDQEDNYKLEDPDDEMDEDLELKDEEDEYSETPAPSSSRGLPLRRANKPATQSRGQPQRESRKRNFNYYEVGAEDLGDDAVDTSVSTTPRPQDSAEPLGSEDLDPDLILTDEEAEYNPANHRSRMTERQRRLEMTEELSGSDTAKKSKVPKKEVKETEEQAALRKAETARRRLDYKNKQLEEEKQDTLNKLLKRRANKVREVQDAESKDEVKLLKPRRPVVKHPALMRYTNVAGGSTLSIA